jgi:hypothetical protein
LISTEFRGSCAGPDLNAARIRHLPDLNGKQRYPKYDKRVMICVLRQQVKAKKHANPLSALRKNQDKSTHKDPFSRKT